MTALYWMLLAASVMVLAGLVVGFLDVYRRTRGSNTWRHALAREAFILPGILWFSGVVFGSQLLLLAAAILGTGVVVVWLTQRIVAHVRSGR